MATFGKMYIITVCVGLWLTMMLLSQPCEGRYLPTRSHGDELEKLRELMLQILESSNEDSQRPPNEANGNTVLQRSSWPSKLSAMDAVDGSRKYGYGPRSVYDGPRFY